MQRIVSIDLAKGLAILLVVIGHFTLAAAPQWWDVAVNWIYSFHMPLFLMASGYVYMATRKPGVPYVDFVKRKFLRLMVPYLVTSAIIISLKLAFPEIESTNPVSPRSFLEMFWLPKAGYFLWFIWTIWTMFLIVPFCNSRRLRLILWIAALVVSYLPDLPNDTPFMLAATQRFGKYFVFGMVMFDFPLVRERLMKVSPWLVSLLFFGLFAGSEMMADGASKYIVTLLLAYLGIWWTCLLCRRLASSGGVVERWALAISGCSYLIYLFHTSFEAFTKSVILHFDPQIPFMAVMLATVLVGTAGPMLVQNYIVSRVPLFRFLFGLGGWRKNFRSAPKILDNTYKP